MSTTTTTTTPTTDPIPLRTHGSLVYPGDRIGTFDEKLQLNGGLYIVENIIFSSVLGALNIETINTTSNTTEEKEEEETNTNMGDEVKTDSTSTSPTSSTPSTLIISVLPLKDQLKLPKIGDTVICRVKEIQTRQAFVAIEFIEGSTEIFSQCRGVIRSRDVRSLDTDGVIIYDSFRPGDIVKAVIISLGDARSYYLSTAKIHLGVVYAENIEGVGMTLVPPKDEFKSTALVQYMKCPLTGSIQPRKAALPMD